MGRTTPIDAARQALADADATVGEWTGHVADARQQLEQHRQTAGGQAVADVAALDAVAEEAVRLTARLEAAQRTLQAAEGVVVQRLADLASAAVGEVDKRLLSARKTLTAHQSRTNQLIAELLDHEGSGLLRMAEPWWYEPGTAEVVNGRGPLTFETPRSHRLQAEVGHLEDLIERLMSEAAQPSRLRVEALLVEADPDGPEAQAAADRTAEVEADQVAQVERVRRDREVARRVRERMETLITAPQVHPTRAIRQADEAMRSVRLPAGPDRDREAHVQRLVAALSWSDHRNLDEARLRALAEDEYQRILDAIGQPAMAGA